MKTIKVQSGAEVSISAGSWSETMALNRAINQHLSEGLTSEVNPMQLALKVESSPDVYSAIFACLARCTYNGKSINETTFEDVAAREDYLDIVQACIECNLAPFKKKHPSQLLTFLGVLNQVSDDQK